MSGSKNAELWRLWRERLKRFESWDQTVEEFCRWEGISAAAFYLWRKKLHQQPVAKHRTSLRSKSSGAGNRPLFLPVLPAVGSAESAAVVGDLVVMTLSDGTRVELPAGDHQLIAHVVTSVASLRGGER